MFKIFTEHGFVFLGILISILVVIVGSTIVERRRKPTLKPWREVMELSPGVWKEQLENFELPEGQNVLAWLEMLVRGGWGAPQLNEALERVIRGEESKLRFELQMYGKDGKPKLVQVELARGESGKLEVTKVEVQEFREPIKQEPGKKEVEVESNLPEEKPDGKASGNRTSGVAQEPRNGQQS